MQILALSMVDKLGEIFPNFCKKGIVIRGAQTVQLNIEPIFWILNSAMDAQ
jgi:hypothetical protein